MTLYKLLRQYGDSDYYGFHMPGHKRNKKFMEEDLPYEIDITEIEGFDDLHHCEGIIKQAQDRASRLYGAEETHFLVNGSTSGILSAIGGCTNRGDSILISRHCHKSVYHAVELFGLKPYYVYPEKRTEEMERSVLNGQIYADTVDRMLKEHPEIQAVMIVSPTYDGVISDVREIAETAHRHGIPLIVDEAHGAHFGFCGYFPENANRLGADVVIHSVHKTLPALTQSALLHINGKRADRNKIKKYLQMLQSSSPSYILMAGIDACMQMLENKGKQEFERYAEDLQELRQALGQMRSLKLECIPQYDRSKLVLSTAGTDISSRDLEKILREKFHLQMEMTAGDYVLAMTSLADTKEGLERLKNALLDIDKGLTKLQGAKERYDLPEMERILLPWEASEIRDREFLPFEECEGKICLEYAYLYPPGSPIAVPGERISKEAKDLLIRYRNKGFSIQGTEEENRIGVWING